jgi:alpha-1,2-mannosyltransferase
LSFVGTVKRVVLRAGYGLLPLLAAAYIAGTLIPGSNLWPWHPGMIDLEVYQRTGALVLQGQDFFHVAEGLPWIYPPFAALLSVPFSLVGLQVAALAWLAICVIALGALLYRFGLNGWRLSLAITCCVLLVEPVRETLGFGQLGILLVAAACLDSLPGKRFFRRRLLPEGWLVGVATAVKLTPAVIAVYKFFAGLGTRAAGRKAGLVAFAAFCAATALGFILFSPSLYYWNALAHGETGVNGSFVYASNQSVMGVWARLSGGDTGGVGLLLCVAVIVLGVIAAIRADHAGYGGLAVCLAGLTSLLGSPVSWSHHYVWVVPLTLVFWQAKALPPWYRWLGLGYCAWVIVAPFMWLPRDNDVELTYAWWQQVIVNGGVAAGVVILVCAFFLPPSVETKS